MKFVTLVIEEDDYALDESSPPSSLVEHSFPDGEDYAEVELEAPETEAEVRC